MTASLAQIATIVLAESHSHRFEDAPYILPETKNFKVLSEGLAFESDVSRALTQKDILRALDAVGIKADVCVQPKGERRKKLLICDMDSTLIGQECIDELADFAGVKDRVSEITERAMRGEIGFEGALTERVKLLKGLDLSVLQTCYDERIALIRVREYYVRP